jgi:mannitol-1-phosphate 5-dehydrogenase
VDTVIGRMVPPPTPELRAADPARIMVEPYKVLPVDRTGFIGSIPEIVGMEVCDNFHVYTARKLYLHNCGHAILGYLGYLRGHLYGYQALEDGVIRKAFEAALGESIAGIVASFGVEKVWLDNHQADLTRRFANMRLGDTSFRLGRDPIRKLAYNDRLVGAAFDAVDDPISQELQEMIRQKGLSGVMEEVSAIRPGEPLADLVVERYRKLRQGAMPG